MKKLLIFPFDLLSHYTRCLVLADQLKEKYEVLFQYSAKYNHLVQDKGFKTFQCKAFDPEIVMPKIEKFNFSWISKNTIEPIFESQCEVIKALQPSAVLGDVAPTLKMAAEVNNVKYIALMNGYMSKYYSGINKLPDHNIAFTIANKLPIPLFKLGEQIIFWNIHSPFRKIRSKLSLKAIANYRNELEGDENWICDDNTIFPQKQLPANYKIIGPLLFKNTNKSIQHEENTKKKTMVVSMGSSGDWKKLNFLTGPEFEQFNIIACGKGNNTLSASHIQNYDFIDLDIILPKAKLMICHAGNGTVYKGIEHKIKMAFVTAHFEQKWNAVQFSKNGHGIDLTDLSREKAIANIKQMMTNGN